MQALKKAIISKFNATAALKSLMPGGLWDIEADQGSAYPYGVFQIISDVEDVTFSDVKDNIIVQFKIFDNTAKSSVKLDAVLIQLLAAYNRKDLTLTAGSFVSMQKQNVMQNKSDNIWEYLVLFRVIIVNEK
jgi:hypothetical protein